MSRVHLIATGGTIASRSGSSGRQATVRAQDLLGSLHVTPSDMDITYEDAGTRGSYAFDTADLLRLARQVRTALEQGVDGIVVTHGTDVMEESAFLLDLLHDDARPVVLTGAQRPFDDGAPDGPANLRDALVVAGSAAARHCGAVVAFDGLVFAARGVVKVDTSASQAFAAPGRGPLMRVLGDKVHILARNVRTRPLQLPLGLERLPRVDVISVYAGADAVLLDASVDAGASAVVLAALGAGNAGPLLIDGVGRAVATGVPVVVCSRVAAGSVAPLYTGGWKLKKAGALFGSDLSPWQARLLTAVACALSPQDPSTILSRVLVDRGP